MWIAVLWGFAFFNAGSASAQISPGDLAEPHAFIEGMKNCLKCHELGAGPSITKCLDCHKEIALGIDKKHGYHHIAVTVEGTHCAKCHNEHAGRDFQLIFWPDGMNAFDHKKTGWELLGKHASVKCRDCHKPEFVTKDLEQYQPDIDLKRTFLGLEARCLDCHFDEHRGQLAKACENCHNNDGWKPAPTFDHDKAKFRLTGKHRDVKCEKCHPTVKAPRERDTRGKKTLVKYTGLALACSGCHDDVHKDKFGTACDDCHRTSGWQEIVNKDFDHSRTRFPLKGKHASVECKKCHVSGHKNRELAFEHCTSCHEDIHRGQFVAHLGVNCERCHNEDGFLPALFTLANHDDSRFPLKGAHIAQPCFACHKAVTDPKGQFHNYTFKDRTCKACHEDVHQAQFMRHGPKKDCEACHITTRWTDLDFDHDRDSSYPLVGAHRKATCDGCHKQETRQGKRLVRYRPLEHACKACHDVTNLKELN